MLTVYSNPCPAGQLRKREDSLVMRRIVWMLSALLGLPGAGLAETPIASPQPVPELITDRPDFTESAASVPDGFVQVEFGAEFANDEAGQALSLPLALVRWGLGGGFELRFGIPSLLATWPADDVEVGVSQTDLGTLELGAKYVYKLSEAAAIGVIPYVAVPLKGDQYDSLGVALGAKLVWAVDATDWLSVGGNFGLAFIGLGAQTEDREYSASLAFGFATTDSLGLFLEVFTEFAETFSDEAPVFVDGGLTFLASERFQADVYVGMDLRHAPEAVFAGLGGSYLW